MCKDKSTDFGLGLMIGVIGGIIAGVLYAPKSGEEMREKVKETVCELAEKHSPAVREAKKQALESIDLLKYKLEQKYNKFGNMLKSKKKETDKKQFAKMTEYCESLGVPHHVVKTDIAEIIFDARKESNPCSLCAKMRRGALNNEINRLGGGKLALGHNADDVVETMLLSLLYEGRFSCFSPTAHMDKSGVSLIRPLIYLEEYDVKSAVARLNLPILKNPCPANHQTKREYAKNLIKQIGLDVPNAKQSMLGAIYHPERANLWDASDTSRRYEKNKTKQQDKTQQDKTPEDK